MSLNINRRDILVVNKVWMALGITTIKQGLIQIYSENNGIEAGRPFDIEYEYLGDGKYNFDKIITVNPVSLDEWLKLPIRPYDTIIHTSNKVIRVPTVIQAQNCDKTHLRKIKLTTKNILERDNYTCQYSGKKLPKHLLSIDHVEPVSKGGQNTWKNMVACAKDINSKKGNKSNKEAGLSLIKEPKEPLAIPASSLIREIRNRDWHIFLHK